MADPNDIERCTKELAKVLGAIFYVTTNLEQSSPEHYALWVAVHRGADVLDQLKKELGLGGSDVSLH